MFEILSQNNEGDGFLKTACQFSCQRSVLYSGKNYVSGRIQSIFWNKGTMTNDRKYKNEF